MNVICNICGNNSFNKDYTSVDYLSGKQFEVQTCTKCKTMQTGFNHSKEQISEYYPKEYFDGRKSLVDSLINGIRLKALNNIKSYEKQNTILDIGCGTGSFLASLDSNHWKRLATETAPERIEDIKKKGINVCLGKLKDCNFNKESIDFVTLWHVLEHVVNPKETILEVNNILKKGGYCVIEVPNSKSWQARISKKDWFHLDVPRHLYHFSPKTLYNLLNDCGFKITKISFYSPFYDIFGFIQSIINKVTNRKNLLFDLINGKLSMGSALVNSAFDFAKTVVLLPFLIILALPFLLAGIIVKRSGVMIVYAQKR